MESVIKFVLSEFWIFVGFNILFIGFLILLNEVLNFVLRLWNRFWRHWNIRKHGYPPKWCDADGDFKQEDNNV